MPVVNGNGGFLTVFYDGDEIIDPDPENRRFHVGKWSLESRSQSTDVSNASVSGSRYAHVQGDASWTCEVPLDDDLYPEAAGLRRGDIAYIWFRIGATDNFHNLAQTTIMSVVYESNSTGDVVRLMITGAGGSLNENVPVLAPPEEGYPPSPGQVELGGGGIGLGAIDNVIIGGVLPVFPM